VDTQPLRLKFSSVHFSSSVKGSISQSELKRFRAERVIVRQRKRRANPEVRERERAYRTSQRGREVNRQACANWRAKRRVHGKPQGICQTAHPTMRRHGPKAADWTSR
jgi:hypothetical protein